MFTTRVSLVLQRPEVSAVLAAQNFKSHHQMRDFTPQKLFVITLKAGLWGREAKQGLNFDTANLDVFVLIKDEVQTVSEFCHLLWSPSCISVQNIIRQTYMHIHLHTSHDILIIRVFLKLVVASLSRWMYNLIINFQYDHSLFILSYSGILIYLH